MCIFHPYDLWNGLCQSLTIFGFIEGSLEPLNSYIDWQVRAYSHVLYTLQIKDLMFLYNFYKISTKFHFYKQKASRMSATEIKKYHEIEINFKMGHKMANDIFVKCCAKMFYI